MRRLSVTSVLSCCSLVGGRAIVVFLAARLRGASGPPPAAGPPRGTDSKSVLTPSPVPQPPSPAAHHPPSAIRLVKTSGNLLRPDGFTPFEKGGQQQGEVFLCDNGSDTAMIRGIMQKVELNQPEPEPVFAVAYSKAEGVTGKADADYSLFVNFIYTDGTYLFKQNVAFSVGTHDWERREFYAMPEKPLREVYFYYLFRKHGGKAWFKGAELHTVKRPTGRPRPGQMARARWNSWTRRPLAGHHRRWSRERGRR